MLQQTFDRCLLHVCVHENTTHDSAFHPSGVGKMKDSVLEQSDGVPSQKVTLWLHEGVSVLLPFSNLILDL